MPRPSVLSRRNPHLNKYDFGHVLVVAGSAPMLGAAALTALSAMRSGAGLVTAAVPAPLNLALQKKINPVIMTLPLPKEAFPALRKNFAKYNAAAIGPGLGLTSTTTKLVYSMVEHYPGPLVIDADALNAIAKNLKILGQAKGPRLLTPHAGEMARLTGLKAEYIEKNAKKVALEFCAKYDVVVLIKGHRTVVAARTKTYVNTTGNVGMATAGSGDVLTGIITGLLAQGLPPFNAACEGAYEHGKAGDRAAKARSKRAMIATDIIDQL